MLKKIKAIKGLPLYYYHLKQSEKKNPKGSYGIISIEAYKTDIAIKNSFYKRVSPILKNEAK